MVQTGSSRPTDGTNKGAVEHDVIHPDDLRQPRTCYLAGQLGHRDQDEMLKEADTDFPEPDAEAEISGH
jgi:hypothetical protein